MNSPGTNEATNARPAKDAGAGRLGRRLALGVILFSALVTGVITVLELYRQYRMEVDEIARQFISINRSMVPALAEAVWVEDSVQIRIILDGLVSLRDVESATVMAEGAKSWSAGARVSKRTLAHAVPLHRTYKGSEVAIGRLDIVASVDNVYDRLWNMLLVTLAFNAVKTTLVVFFMVYLFRRLVGRHLQDIACHVIGLGSDRAAALALEREPGDGLWRPDILDEVVAAVNQANEALSAQRVQIESQVAVLRESEGRFRRAVVESPFPIILHAEDGEVLQISRSWSEITGYAPEEIPTIADWTERAYGERKELVRTDIERLYALDRRIAEGDYTIRTKDGAMRVWDFSSAPLGRLPDGRRLVISMAMDVTGLKRAEEERQKFFLLVESSSEFIAMCDLDMNPLYVNPAGRRMVGLPDMATARRVKVPDYYFPEDQRFIAEEFFPRVLREGHGDVEIRLRHFQTGEPIWMFYYLFSVHDTGGTPVGWATVSRDITQRKAAEAQQRRFFEQVERDRRALVSMLEDQRRTEEYLRKSEERFANIFRVSPAAITITGLADGKYLNVNESFVKIFDFKAEEVIGHTSSEINVIGKEARNNILKEQIGTSGVVNAELIAHTKSGREINLLFSSIPMNIDGEDCLVTTMIDITDRKQAEEELRKYQDHLEDLVKERTHELAQANLRLQELDRLKSMFIASMSHELRTPLNSIIGFTGIILMGMSGEISTVQKKQLGMVKNSANHLLDLINDVIDVSKIEAGKTDLSMEAFDLSDLALEVKESFAVAATEKGLKLEWRTDGEAEVTSDRRRVRQILVNLIGNAIKFTETGTVAISVLKATKGFEIKVRDTGIGMYKEDMERLFMAFSRIHIQGRPVVEGTGLGLYLSRRIAALLGGEITAESEPGQGSKFTLSLPWKYPEGKE